MTTPREFAERYMQRELYMPFLSNMSSLLYLPDSTVISELEMIYKTHRKNKALSIKNIKLDSLENNAIDTDTKKRIYNALHELIHASDLDIRLLRKLNKDFIKKRKDTIKYLEKTIEYPFLEKKKIIKAEIERLKAYDKKSKSHHTFKEIDFISSCYHIIYSGLLKKLVLKIEIRKLSEMLSMPMNFKKGRPQRFFFKVLQIVVFRYINENAKIPKEKAKNLAVEIIDEYIGKKGYKDIVRMRTGDIYNARNEL